MQPGVDLVCFDYDRDGSPCLILASKLFDAIQKSIAEDSVARTEDGSVLINLGELGFVAKRLVVHSDEPPCEIPNGLC